MHINSVLKGISIEALIIGVGIITNEAYIQMLMQAILKEAFFFSRY